MNQFQIKNKNNNVFEFVDRNLNIVPEKCIHVGTIEFPSLISNFSYSIITGYSINDFDEKMPYSFIKEKLKQLFYDNDVLVDYQDNCIPEYSFDFSDLIDYKYIIEDKINKIKKSIIPRKAMYNVWMRTH